MRTIQASKIDRGYGSHHQRLRKELMAAFQDGDLCARCQAPMRLGDPIDLDHNDNRIGYLGLSHRSCNRRAGNNRMTYVVSRLTLADLAAQLLTMFCNCAGPSHTKGCLGFDIKDAVTNYANSASVRIIPRQPEPCPICGQPKPNRTYTCGRECGVEYSRRKRDKAGQPTWPQSRVCFSRCPHCGDTFASKNRQQRYCSPRCVSDHQRYKAKQDRSAIIRHCPDCGKSIGKGAHRCPECRLLNSPRLRRADAA